MAQEKKFCNYNLSEELIGEAKIFVGKPDSKKVEWRGKEVMILTYLKYGKPFNIFLPVEEAKKFERFIPFCDSESVKGLVWKKIQVSTGFVVL